jgi:hypothetical protein
MKSPPKKRASSPQYISPHQTILPGFESPFSQKLDANNRWIVLSHKIPWDTIAGIYKKQMSSSTEGRPSLSPRLVIGALIIKHLNNWSDEETILQIQENMYLQYFVGFSSFTTSRIFDSSLFVEIRKRMGDEQINSINELIVKIHLSSSSSSVNKTSVPPPTNSDKNKDQDNETPSEKAHDVSSSGIAEPQTHHGRMITDATATPQDIAFPTDLNLLSTAREKTEDFIDCIYNTLLHDKKPRTYRNVARKDYLNLAKKKNKSGKAIRNGIGKQLNYLKRNLKSINKLLDVYETKGKKFPLVAKQHRYLLIIQTLYNQQKQMHTTFTHRVDDRIVSIHQPHVRPIVRGKVNAKVEFGAKIEVTLANGFAFLDDLSWDAFNEGSRLIHYVEKYKTRFGYYPKEVLADQIFCNKENRKKLKELGIKLMAKPLGRPSATAVKEYVRPGERNPIEGKFGQGKNAYGLGRIKARLKETSQSWIASIILVLNLVKLAGLEKYAQILCFIEKAHDKFFSNLLKLQNPEFFSKPYVTRYA